MGFPSNRDAITALKSKQHKFLKSFSQTDIFLEMALKCTIFTLYQEVAFYWIQTIYRNKWFDSFALIIFAYIIGLPTCFVCTNYGKPIKTSIHMVEHTR